MSAYRGEIAECAIFSVDSVDTFTSKMRVPQTVSSAERCVFWSWPWKDGGRLPSHVFSFALILEHCHSIPSI